METFVNQKNNDEYLTLPIYVATKVIARMIDNPKCTIYKIDVFKDTDGIIKYRIKYSYD